jgi:hypothetical protein
MATTATTMTTTTTPTTTPDDGHHHHTQDHKKTLPIGHAVSTLAAWTDEDERARLWDDDDRDDVVDNDANGNTRRWMMDDR